MHGTREDLMMKSKGHQVHEDFGQSKKKINGTKGKGVNWDPQEFTL